MHCFVIQMDETTSSSLLHVAGHIVNSFIDSPVLRKQTNVPKQFVWPKTDLVCASQELMEPVVDLKGFLGGDEEATRQAVTMIRAACLKHGFFQVINHGVDLNIICLAQESMEDIFKLPMEQKLRARSIGGSSLCGYSGAHADRYNSKLPWKETFSFRYGNSTPAVADFFTTSLGKDFEKTGVIYQKYCEAMMKLSLSIMELLAISLGINRTHYKKFFEDGLSIMRCNFYPSCQEPELTLGTGPHCDPTSITILHQDHVGGLEVFTNNVWHSVRPRQGALVINIGDTFVALSNGNYKSCLHRAVVNKYQERKSLAFFLCPREDKVVRPAEDIVKNDGGRSYPDFTWSEFLHFTERCYRTDGSTLQNFSKWLLPGLGHPISRD